LGKFLTLLVPVHATVLGKIVIFIHSHLFACLPKSRSRGDLTRPDEIVAGSFRNDATRISLFDFQP